MTWFSISVVMGDQVRLSQFLFRTKNKIKSIKSTRLLLLTGIFCFSTGASISKKTKQTHCICRVIREGNSGALKLVQVLVVNLWKTWRTRRAYLFRFFSCYCFPPLPRKTRYFFSSMFSFNFGYSIIGIVG